MLDKLVTGIYNNCINLIISKVTVDKEIIAREYRNYLYNAYELVAKKGGNLKQLITICSELENSKWQNASEQAILTEVVNDINMRQLMYMSNIAMEYAEKKNACLKNGQNYQPEITAVQAQEYIAQMKTLRAQVLPFNSVKANILLSEGIMDLQYAANITEDTSLRRGRIR